MWKWHGASRGEEQSHNRVLGGKMEPIKDNYNIPFGHPILFFHAHVWKGNTWREIFETCLQEHHLM